MAATILIVEDQEINRQLLNEILVANGYRTLEGTDGRAGVEIALRLKPDLILMDIRMPVIDGFEALKRLRANPETRTIPVIALTGNAMKEDREKIRASGFDGYLSKPYDIDELLAEISRLLRSRMASSGVNPSARPDPKF